MKYRLLWAVWSLLAIASAAFAAPAQPTQPAQPYPVAAFFQPVRNFDALKAMGVNTLFGPCVENEQAMAKSDPAQLERLRAEWITTAGVKGFKVVLKTPPPVLPPHCVGVMLMVDEPNGKVPVVTGPQLKAESDALRKAYPGVPVFLSLAGDKVTSANFVRKEELAQYKAYADVADVLTVDMYAMNRNASRYQTTWTGEGVKKLSEAVSRPVWAWVEVNDQQLSRPPPNQGVNRAPTPDEIRATIDAAVKAGAKGIGAFLTCDSSAYGWPASFMPPVDRNGASMQPQYDAFRAWALSVNPPPVVLPTDTEIRLTRELAEAKAALVVANAEIVNVRTERDTAVIQAQTAADTLNTTRDALNARLAELDAWAAKAKADVSPVVVPAAKPTTKPSALLANPDPQMYADGYGPTNWAHGSSVNSIRVASDPVPYGSIYPRDWSEARIKALATLCRDGGSIDKTWMAGNGIHVIYAGAPTYLDYEATVITPAQVVQHLKWFKSEAPNVPVSVIGYPYYDASFSGEPFRAVHDLCDFVNGGGYLSAPQWVARDLKTIRDDTSRIRSLYPAKPMFFWVAAQYVNETAADGTPAPLKPDDASSLWALGREFTAGPKDQILIYCDLAGGYQVTKKIYGGMK